MLLLNCWLRALSSRLQLMPADNAALQITTTEQRQPPTPRG